MNSPTLRRAWAGWRWGGALLVFGFCWLMLSYLGNGNPITEGLFSLLGGIVFALISPALFRRSRRRLLLKLLSEGSRNGMIGEHELEITDTGLSARSQNGEGKIQWSALDRMDTTPDYLYLFLDATRAFIIPRARVLEGDFAAFLAVVEERFAPGQQKTDMKGE